MEGKENSDFRNLKHQLLAAVLFNFSFQPSITNFANNVPRAWEKKTKKTLKTSSVIRFLANLLPEQEAQRIYIQKELLEPLATEIEKDTSSDRLWQLPPPVSIADIPWLERIEPDPAVRQRIEVLTRILEEDNQPDLKKQKTDLPACLCTPGLDQSKCCPCQTQESGYRTSLGTSFGTPSFTTASVSTPLPSANVSRTPDLATKQRISELEEMVQMLKDQMANMTTQLQLNQNMASTASSAVPQPPLPPVPTAPGGPPPPPPPPGAPPPPPPPPPPVATQKQMMSISEIIRQNKSKNGKDTGSTSKSNTPQGGMDMREILKGLGTVKLKTVPRSPGGTPLKQDTLPCDVNDHAAVFARALKRKFSLCPVGSPDSEKENNTPPGPHLLKRITANRKILRRSKPLANVTNS